jgi:hypothetical protein
VTVKKGSVENRLTRLEEQILLLNEAVSKLSSRPETGLSSMVGTHANDPVFAEIVRLGKAVWEKDLVPVGKKRRSRPKAR